ncbi:hypothetical protein [Phytoactinopolyspora limicola]|nr:hypothetical protein [Phytoactinopolyspora limicola]
MSTGRGVDAYALAEFLQIRVTTIRSWENRGKIIPTGKDRRGTPTTTLAK